ncbi:Hypothetical protein CINCED_3A006064 [Cinara cedri]|uniref:Uncharacterized protein n=1 Tax=Cinara cedri TaxID=506608 RepID=A0A5E4MC35_9HEMI|nr:Hypothetical protein CINCED_3A006064 [Cinara cedri]
MYNNRVLLGNWYEDRIGKFALQKDGNTDSTYQSDYRVIEGLSAQDNRALLWKLRDNAVGLPVESFREHGAHNVYKNNLSSTYNLNCAIAYHSPSPRSYRGATGLWEPERNLLANYGPGPSKMVENKRRKWNSENSTSPITEYQCSYSKTN